MHPTHQRHITQRLVFCVAKVILLCWAVLGVVRATGTDGGAEVVVSAVIVKRGNIFDTQAKSSAQGAVKQLASGVNRFHKTTLKTVIRREVGISAGDTVTVAEVAEAERRLRNLGIFASVSTKLVTAASGVELHVTTRDNFSIVAGASGSYLGGVGNVGFTTGEKNLLGTGNTLLFSLSRTTTGNYRGSVAFSDLHFLDKPWRSNYSIGRSNEGDFFSVKFSDPFRSLGDHRAWSIGLDRTERFIKYYRDGSVVVQIPEDRSKLTGSHVWRSGNSDQYFRRGIVASITQSEFSVASFSQSAGVLSEQVTVPEDSRRLYLGGLIAQDAVQGYKKVQGIDTLNYVQDLRLGSSAEMQLGVNVIDRYGAMESATETEPTLSILLSKSAAVGEHSLVKVALSGSAALEESGGKPWSATASFKAYNTRVENFTLALNTDYTTGEDGSGLPVQLTLGENNGLRGYDTRQFDGRERWRLNLESRYRTGWKLGVLDVGLLGFIDAGWVAPRSDSSPSLKRSLGAGLRLASNSLLGPRVIRIDLAAPLDSVAGNNPDPSLSIAVGQVFRF